MISICYKWVLDLQNNYTTISCKLVLILFVLFLQCEHFVCIKDTVKKMHKLNMQCSQNVYLQNNYQLHFGPNKFPKGDWIGTPSTSIYKSKLCHRNSNFKYSLCDILNIILYKMMMSLDHIVAIILIIITNDPLNRCENCNRSISIYIKIQPRAIDLSMRLWGIHGFIPQSLMLRSIVLGWILI